MAASSETAMHVSLNSHLNGFDVLVIGCGGGPSESNLSAYLMRSRAHAWSEGCVGLEGGRIWSRMRISVRYKPRHLLTGADHLSGMVLSAGYMPTRKNVFASPRTTQTILSAFAGGLWPPLAASHESESCKAYLCQSLDTNGTATVELCPGLSARAMLVSHGCGPHEAAYDSTAFFIADRSSGREMLFFGDVEPDSVSTQPRNRAVWAAAAPLVAAGTLSTIFIECSYASDRPVEALFGHLSPPYLLEELGVLANLVPKRPERPLEGVTIVITHIKDDLTGAAEPIHDRIARELDELEAQHQLGVRFVIARQGMRLTF